MATPAQWVAGARPRTLPAAFSPVLAGTAVAAWSGLEIWWKAALALLVSVLLQIGVNYANDYSDGIRGTDAERVGPMRLVGSGAAAPRAVKAAAFGCFGLAAACGLALAATTAWWLVLVGALSIVAAWFYTGGSRPYGYRGLGEVMVFCFFGLVAVMGTTYVQVHDHGWFTYGAPPPNPWLASLSAAVGVGALTCAILVANNLRDIPTDREVGKRTLAVLIGDRGSRAFYIGLVVVALLALLAVGWRTTPVALAGLAGFVPLVRACAVLVRGATGRDLVPVLQQTGVGELVYAAGMLLGVLIAR